MDKRAELIDIRELQNEAFWKGLKVIQSCTNLYQLDSAKKYTDRYIELFCKNRKGTLLATESVAHQYETLQIALKEQREKLN